MKKLITFLIPILFVTIVATVSSAGYLAVSRTLEDADSVEITNYDLTTNTAVYSETLDVYDNGGYMSLLVTENIAGGTGDVDVSVEYSTDKTNFYTAYTSSGGVLVADDNIVTGLQNVTRWIVHVIRMGRYIRYKFYPNADSTITVKQIYLRAQ